MNISENDRKLFGRVLVTGANGFVGQHLCRSLSDFGAQIVACARTPGVSLRTASEVIEIGDISTAEWAPHLENVNYIFHLAGSAHVFEKEGSKKLAAFRKTNVLGTQRLAQAAKRAGVLRMVYVSSIKVNGESNTSGYLETDSPHPEDAYGISKLEAEEALQSSGIEHVIVRPPLVYGKGVKGNFAKLVKLAEKGIPLPLASVNNRRSLVFVENLVDFLAICMRAEAAKNEVFLVSDGEPVSTPELIQLICDQIRKPARLVPFPPGLLRTMASLTGKLSEIDKLIGSLVVNSSKARTLLSWEPPFSLQEGLRKTLCT